jgi:predicted nucleotide-binding protein
MTVLKVSRVKASEVLADAIKQGVQLDVDAQSVMSVFEYGNWKLRRDRWKSLIADAAVHIYGEGAGELEEVQKLLRKRLGMDFIGAPEQVQQAANGLRVRAIVNVLTSLSERLAYAEEPAGTLESLKPSVPMTTTVPNVVNRDRDPTVIFLVHGSDEGARETVARFLERAGSHEVVILHEQANRGRTLIEKFEDHASQASYAVILLTADDVGGPKATGASQHPRARQNVVFELGFFCGSIGRHRVAVLYEPDVEKPSDIDGLVYIALDTAGAWKVSVVRELRDAGLNFDANAA